MSFLIIASRFIEFLQLIDRLPEFFVRGVERNQSFIEIDAVGDVRLPYIQDFLLYQPLWLSIFLHLPGLFAVNIHKVNYRLPRPLGFGKTQ